MQKSTSGFTIVELLIVIVVIAILAAISIVAFNGVQSRARDSERVTDMRTVHKKLEIYQIENGSYPNASQMNNTTFREQTVRIPRSALISPGGGGLHYCWSDDVNKYCYVPRNQANNGDCTGSVDPLETCRSYALSYRLESDPTTMVQLYSLQR